MKNKKGVVFAILALFVSTAMFAAGSDSYKVESVIGKVQYEVSPSVWKNVTVGQELSASTVVNTSLNSSLNLSKNGKKFSIKAMKKGSVESLATAGVAGIQKSGTGLSITVADDVEKTSESIKTASSRASEAKADIEWDE